MKNRGTFTGQPPDGPRRTDPSVSLAVAGDDILFFFFVFQFLPGFLFPSIFFIHFKHIWVRITKTGCLFRSAECNGVEFHC